jgi:hypothetical protein
MADDDLSILEARPGWTVTADLAIYAPEPGSWTGRVARMKVAGRSYERFHVAIVDPGGVARYTKFATMVSEARRLAEGHVQAALRKA